MIFFQNRRKKHLKPNFGRIVKSLVQSVKSLIKSMGFNGFPTHFPLGFPCTFSHIFHGFPWVSDRFSVSQHRRLRPLSWLPRCRGPCGSAGRSWVRGWWRMQIPGAGKLGRAEKLKQHKWIVQWIICVCIYIWVYIANTCMEYGYITLYNIICVCIYIWWHDPSVLELKGNRSSNVAMGNLHGNNH